MNSLEFIKQHVEEWPSDKYEAVTLLVDGTVQAYHSPGIHPDEMADLSEHFAPDYYDGKVWTREEFEALSPIYFNGNEWMRDLKIHKYIVPVSGVGIETKEGAEIISVGSQGNDVVVWVIENINNHVEHRNVFGKMTGESVNCSDQYHGTTQMANGIVVHVFEEGPA